MVSAFTCLQNKWKYTFFIGKDLRTSLLPPSLISRQLGVDVPTSQSPVILPRAPRDQWNKRMSNQGLGSLGWCQASSGLMDTTVGHTLGTHCLEGEKGTQTHPKDT